MNSSTLTTSLTGRIWFFLLLLLNHYSPANYRPFESLIPPLRLFRFGRRRGCGGVRREVLNSGTSPGHRGAHC